MSRTGSYNRWSALRKSCVGSALSPFDGALTTLNYKPTNMTDVDEFARGESMHARPMPQSFVRPVSLDKVREHSSSRTICGSDVKAEQMSSQHTERSKALTVQSQNDQLYHRMLERKLAAEGDSRNRKPHFVRLEDRSKQLYDDHAQR